jgi:Na+/H+ antiporter
MNVLPPLAEASQLMSKVDLMLILLGIIATVALLSSRLRLPFPILLVFAGTLIAFLPGLPDNPIDPELVFLIFLPPLLYSSALAFPWADFRRNLKPILLLAVGLVVVTTVAVALVAWWLVPGITLAAAFVLGAIVSPPDAVAANSVLERTKVEPKVRSILEGESLVNDAVGLVAYQFAIAAVVTGVFSIEKAAFTLVWAAAGGVGWGLLCGWLVLRLHQKIHDPSIQLVISVMTPWLAYLPADRFGASGVLAAVAAGMFIGFHAHRVFRPQIRLQARSLWGFMTFLLNAGVFILIGFEFPLIWHAVQQHPPEEIVISTVGVILTIVVVRFVWVFVTSGPMGRLIRLRYLTDVHLGHKVMMVISWTGMRGVVSLAAALAIPMLTVSGETFPARNAILFITVAVILFTLVVQGLTLPMLIRLLKIRPFTSENEMEQNARTELLSITINSLENALSEGRIDIGSPVTQILLEHFQTRKRNFERRQNQGNAFWSVKEEERMLLDEMEIQTRLRLEEIRNEGRIDESTRRRIEFDLDTESLRLREILGL